VFQLQVAAWPAGAHLLLCIHCNVASSYNICYLRYEAFVYSKDVVARVSAQCHQLEDVLYCDWCNLQYKHTRHYGLSQ
jgi:hypothetical protein